MRLSAKAVLMAALILFSLNVVNAYGASAPPVLEEGWNLVSAPCNITVAEIKDTLSLDSLEAFLWDGEKYNSVETLERGYGYAVNTSGSLDTSGLCASSSDESPVTVEFHEGWNLMGNPYKEELSFTDAFGDSASLIADIIFELDDGRYQPLLKTDNIQTWQGVWVYAYSPVNLNYNFDCDTLTLSIADSYDSVLDIGEYTALNAICRIGDVDYDLTSQVTWSLDNAGVLEKVDEYGKFEAKSAGSCNVSATFQNDASNSIVVTVNAEPVVLSSISVSSDSSKLTIGDTAKLAVTGLYSDGSTADLTESAVFSVSDEAVGTVSGNIFTAVSAGTADVKATYGDLTSDAITITVLAGPELKSINVSVKPAKIEISETAVLSVTGYYSDGSTADLTSTASVQFDSTMGRLESSGKFYPAKIGSVTFTAEYGGFTSSATLTVTDKQLIWIGLYPDERPDPSVLTSTPVISCPVPYASKSCATNYLIPLPCPKEYGGMYCYNNNYIELGKTGKYLATAYYNDDTLERDITESLEKWEVTDDSILTIESNGIVTPNKAGKVGVRVYKDGVWSEWSWVQVLDSDTDAFMLLEFSNRETIVRSGKTLRINATYYSKIPLGTPSNPYYVNGISISNGGFKAERVTDKAEWNLSDSVIGSYDPSTALFTGSKAGTTTISATYNDVTTNVVDLEVWEPADISYCDTVNPNEASWTDNLTIAQLATDCNQYESGSEVTVSFSALLSSGANRRALDVCLDLFIYDSSGNLVKTFRNSNCTPEALSRAIAGYTPVYEYTTKWDGKDDSGNAVAAGDYTAVARFYILYCPVLKIDFKIK